MKEQLNCLQDNFSLTKDVIIDAYKDVIRVLEDDWRLIVCDKDGNCFFSEKNRPILMLIRKDSGKVVYHTNIFDSWTIDLFISMNVIAWKYIQLPKWILVQDFERAIQMKRF